VGGMIWQYAHRSLPMKDASMPPPHIKERHASERYLDLRDHLAICSVLKHHFFNRGLETTINQSGFILTELSLSILTRLHNFACLIF